MSTIKLKNILLLLLVSVTAWSNDSINRPAAPQLEYVMQLKVRLGKTYTIENTQYGKRTVVPITGGTFEGPLLRGTILNGGADYQLSRSAGRNELEAIYSIQTHDGVYIHVRNRGIVVNGKNASGTPTTYFKAAPIFEAPSDSKYSWLNDALFICEPEFSPHFKGVILNIWKIK